MLILEFGKVDMAMIDSTFLVKITVHQKTQRNGNYVDFFGFSRVFWNDKICNVLNVMFLRLVWKSRHGNCLKVSKSLKILGFASDLQSFLDFSLQPLDRLESFSFSHSILFWLYRTSFFLNKIPFCLVF